MQKGWLKQARADASDASEATPAWRASAATTLAALALLASGCANTPADYTASEIEQAKKVRAYPASAIAPVHTVLGPVSSSSCDALSTQRIAGTEGEALWLLRLETVRLGGDMLVRYACETRSASPLTRCWQSRHCTGQAALRD